MKVFVVSNYEPGTPEDNQTLQVFTYESDAYMYMYERYAGKSMTLDELREMDYGDLMDACGCYHEERELR